MVLPTEVIKIGIAGVTGRMGQAILQAVLQQDRFQVVAASVLPDDINLGVTLAQIVQNAPDNIITTADINQLFSASDLVIDFTAPDALFDHCHKAKQYKTAMVVGTTSLQETHYQALQEASLHTAILQSGNTSLGINVLMKAVQQVAAALPRDYDIEITDAHHRYKRDAPSGTALMLAQAACQGRKLDSGQEIVTDRYNARVTKDPDHIGISAVRCGGIIGEHHVMFGNDLEIVTLKHQALDRSLFAQGALYAGQWLVAQPPGYYSMQDIFA